jgi:7,8-dihydroneopterin aldolase/epimerase/oxygenase
VTEIELSGLELFGYHGVLDQERRLGQPFVFDLWLELRTHPGSDRIVDAVDYRKVAACVREVSDSQRFQLLESLAAAVVDELLARFPLARARVRVRKPEVELGLPVGYSAVSVERERG